MYSESWLRLYFSGIFYELGLNSHLTAKEIAHYVDQTWGGCYSESDITQLLYRMGYVYKKPKLVLGKG